MEVNATRMDRAAFTLVETLVLGALVALSLSILLPATRLVRGNVKALQCASNMRTVTQRFELFVHGESDSDVDAGHGEPLSSRQFFIDDFQERLYGIDEFWNLGSQAKGRLTSDRDLMLCPAGAPQLTKKKGFPCGPEAIKPAQDISLGLNMRLYRAPVASHGTAQLAPVASTRVVADILNHPYVPLVLDVDGAEAARRGHGAFYAAPPVDGVDDPYASGEYWTPSHRHSGYVNVGFVGGHVLKSQAPEYERWDWSYHAAVGR